ncbi:MAG: hypothetical protein LBL73_02785 [Synergistaceae bacterium]|jgi:hypothetical protein|nr:hypothetical protein [Synergistaceae bacterium]
MGFGVSRHPVRESETNDRRFGRRLEIGCGGMTVRSLAGKHILHENRTSGYCAAPEELRQALEQGTEGDT